MNRSILEESAKESAARIESGEYCKEDRVICYALTYIEILEKKLCDLSGTCESKGSHNW